MREALAILNGARLAVTATVVRYGCRPRFADLYEETLLLQNVCTADGDLLTDHLWLCMGSRLAAVDPQPGDLLSFTGRVRAYTKHKVCQRRNGKMVYVRATHDYTLRYVTQIRKLAPVGVEA